MIERKKSWTDRLPTPLRLIWQAIRGWSKDEVPRLGASLAYYTLFSLAPILVIVIAVAGLVFGAEAVRGEIVTQMKGLLGEQGATAVQGLLAGAAFKKGGILATVIGGVAFLAASTGAFLELQHALNKIFRVKVKPGPWFKELITNRLRSFGLVLSIGFLLLVSLAVSAALSAASGWIERQNLGAPIVWQLLNVVVSLGVVTVLFALIYRFLPDVRLEWRDVWIGGLLTAVLFTAGKQLIGLYLGRSSTASSYGVAGSVMILLLWVYYSAQVILLGAELTRLYAEHRLGRSPPPTAEAERAPDAHPSAPNGARADDRPARAPAGRGRR
jgi:membrane protein